MDIEKLKIVQKKYEESGFDAHAKLLLEAVAGIESLQAKVAELQELVNERTALAMDYVNQINTFKAQIDAIYALPVVNISDDSQIVEKVCRAFWRRIELYKSKYHKDLPSELPVEFMASMTTAFEWLPKNLIALTPRGRT